MDMIDSMMKIIADMQADLEKTMKANDAIMAKFPELRKVERRTNPNRPFTIKTFIENSAPHIATKNRNHG